MRDQSTIIIALTCLLAVLSGCSDSTSPPSEKDPRTYTWTVDTIYNPRIYQTILNDVWATSGINVYVVGFSSGYEGKMYHSNGSSWTRVPLHTSEGGTVYGLSELGCIQGFTAKSIFAAGDKYVNDRVIVGVIVRYNGLSWKEELIDSVGRLQSIWGVSAEDLWAGGVHALLRRQGSEWKKVDFPARTEKVQFIRITGSSANDVYFMGGSVGIGTPYPYDLRYDLYHYDGNTLAIVDSAFEGMGYPSPPFGPVIKMIGGRLYSGSRGLLRLDGKVWTRLCDSPNSIVRIAGRSSTRIFAVGVQGLVLHFDGVNGYVYPKILPDVTLTSVWEDDNGVFAVGYDGYKSYVLHGR